MLYRRFGSVFVDQQYQPDAESRTVYFANHNYWWDGLIPLYLNRTRFRQQARAMMEDKQMNEYSFFSKIGAFSVNLSDKRSLIRSLRYAVESLQRPNSCLFIYPEGQLNPPSDTVPEFKGGLSWLYDQLPDADFVPFAIYIDHSKANKPDLYIRIGEAVRTSNDIPRQDQTKYFQNKVHELLTSIKNDL